MRQTTEMNVTTMWNDRQLADLLDTLDRLHSAASEATLDSVTALDRRELVAVLREVVYTAQETLDEIDRQTESTAQPYLRVLEPPASSKRIS